MTQNSFFTEERTRWTMGSPMCHHSKPDKWETLIFWFNLGPLRGKRNNQIGVTHDRASCHCLKCSKILYEFEPVSHCIWSVCFRGERILFFGPNTNTNNIRNQILDRIRIRIIFVFSEWANTNTNNIRAQIFGRIRIRIIFGFRIVPEYEYE